MRPSKSLAELRRVDAPLALHALDHRGLAGLADVDRLHRHRPRLRPGDAERGEPALVLEPLGFLDGWDDRVGGIDALRHVPETLAPDSAGDRHLAAVHQDLQHLGDVAVVRPAARGPRHCGRVRELARAQRARVAQPLEDVAPEAVVVLQPDPRALVARALVRPGEVEAEVARRPDQRVELEQRALFLQRVFQVVGPVRRAEPAPEDQVRARRDRRRRVDLQQGQPLHDLEQVGRTRLVEQLRPDRDPPCLRFREPVHLAPEELSQALAECRRGLALELGFPRWPAGATRRGGVRSACRTSASSRRASVDRPYLLGESGPRRSRRSRSPRPAR